MVPDDVDLLQGVFNGLVSHMPDDLAPADSSSQAPQDASTTCSRADGSAAGFVAMVERHPRLLVMLRDTSSEHTVFLPPPGDGAADRPGSSEEEDLLALHISPHLRHDRQPVVHAPTCRRR